MSHMNPTKLAQLNAHERDARISFDEGPHLYTVDNKYDKETISVTTLVHKCFPGFDAEKQAQRIVSNVKNMKDPNYKYFGKTKEEIKTQWQQAGNVAATAGTSMHYNIECYYNDIPPPNPDTTEFQMFLKFAKDYPHLEPYRTEWVVYHEEIKLCGSIDMVFKNRETNTFEIYDWKRVLQINEKPFQKDDMALLPFLQDVPNVNFWHYTMQLNIYKKMLESNYNMTISRMFLVVIHPEAPYKTYFRLEVPDIQDKIADLFEYRKNKITPPPKQNDEDDEDDEDDDEEDEESQEV